MGTLVNRLNSFFENLPQGLRKGKYAILTIFVGLTIFFAMGTEKIIIDESLDAFFKNNDPAKMIYDDFKVRFGGDEDVYIVYKAKDGDIFSDKSLKALKGIHDDLTNYRLNVTDLESSPLDHITEIKSLINVKYMEASEDSLYSRNFIGDSLPETDAQRETLRQKATQHPDYPRMYLSEDSTYGGILIRTDFNAEIIGDDTGMGGFGDVDVFDSAWNEDDMSDIQEASESQVIAKTDIKKTEMGEYTPFLKELKKILDKPEYSRHLEFHPVGNPVIMDFFIQVVMSDMAKLMGLVLILIILMLYLLFRSFSAVLWPVLVIVLTLVWTMGLIGWSGIPTSSMLNIIVFLVLAIGVADSVHILSGYLLFRNQRFPHEEALKMVMKKSGFACFLTSFTTCVGLLSLFLVPVMPIANFGLFAAVGVLIAFIITIFLMPLMLDLWSPVSKKKQVQKVHLIQRLLRKAEHTGSENPRLVISLFFMAGVIFFMGLMTIKVDSNVVEIIKDGLPLRQTYNLVNEHMGGTGSLEIMFDFKQEDSFKNPEVLFKMERLQIFLEEDPDHNIIKTFSLVNVVKDSYKALNNDDQSFYIIPGDQALLAQTLFLFGNANPKDRRRLVSDDYSYGRLGVNSDNLGSLKALVLINKVNEYIDREFASLKQTYPNLEITLTGNMVLLSLMTDYISWAQIKSFSITLLVITIILLIVLGSYKAGLAAVLPNVFPVLTTFGIMGYMNIPLDMDTLLIAPVIIGLAVDDTIHFMTHFRQDVLRYGNIKKAAAHSIREAGQAICFTSIILSVGFLVFLFSFHKGLSYFGVFSAVAIMTAFIADIYLLPALCTLFRINFAKTSSPLKTRNFRNQQELI